MKKSQGMEGKNPKGLMQRNYPHIYHTKHKMNPINLTHNHWKSSVKLCLHNILCSKFHICLKCENVVNTDINQKQIWLSNYQTVYVVSATTRNLLPTAEQCK